MPAGPLLEYNPAKVKQAPTTPAELLAWCKANPNRLIYARPANSRTRTDVHSWAAVHPRRQDPKRPVTAGRKTGRNLKDLNSCIENITPATVRATREMTGIGGEGSRDIDG